MKKLSKSQIKRRANLGYVVLVILLIGVLIAGYFSFFYSPYKFNGEEPIKIFWINSYHQGFSLVDRTIDAFENYLQEQGMEVEIKKFDMDTIRNDSEENVKTKTQEVLQEIEEFQPDLIYATDDNAQEYVISKYFINSEIPVVFSGVNGDYEDYGYEHSRNIAGVYERTHFIETIEMLTTLFPDTKTLAVVSDDLPQWEDVIEKFKEEQKNIEGVRILSWEKYFTFEGYKEGMRRLQDEGIDSIAFLGITSLEDETGANVPFEEVIKWNVQNLDIPDVTFWDFNVAAGMVLAAQVSDVAQGEAAAKIAKEILIEGKRPSGFEIEHTTEIGRYINLKRAEQLGLEKEDIPSIFLINSKTYENFSWE